MKRILISVFVLAALLVMSILPVVASSSDGSDPAGQDPAEVMYLKQDNKPDPLTTRQQALKQQALEAKLAGKAHGKVHEVALGQYVELEREGEGALWTCSANSQICHTIPFQSQIAP